MKFNVSGFFDAFLFQTLFKGQHSSISWFFSYYCLKMASKIGNISKFTKELEYNHNTKIFELWFYSRDIYKLDCRWHTVYISWKLVVVPKFLKSQNFKTTFQKIYLAYFYLSELILKNQFATTDPVVSTLCIRYMC